MCLYKIRKINYIPVKIKDLHNIENIKDLSVPEYIYNYVKSKGIKQRTFEKLSDVIETTDVIYMARLQKERYCNNHWRPIQYTKLTPSSITRAKKNMIIMHPLPRVDEIDKSLDQDPRAAYFRQMKYGMYLRMALLDLIYG